MGTRVIARRMFGLQVTSGGDKVAAGMWVPANSIVRGVLGHVTFEAAVERGLNEIAQGALAVYVMPVIDPDSSGTMDAVWNSQVPKDSSLDVLDFDKATQVTAPFWEPGATTWEHVFDVGLSPVRMYQAHFLSSMGQNAIAVNRDPETAFDYEYIGGKTLPVALKGPMRVSVPSLLAVGCASPLTTLTSATAAIAAIGEQDWAQLQFIDEVMKRAMMDVLGLTEAGAETPWEEATALLRTHLDPSVLEVAGGIFQPTTWNLSGEMAFEVEVQGSIPTGRTVDLGG